MRPGDTIGERFTVERLTGSGGMGAVYRARDIGTGAAVAIKVLHGHRLAESARFAREGEVLAGLHHPSVVRYVGQGLTPDGDVFLAMEWIEGESLSDRLARGRLSLAEASALGLRLSEALATAHRLGVIHRDIKPSNIMLEGCEIAGAKLVDFGIARMADGETLTETGAMMGTIGYMAPEQARGDRRIDARVDVFSLGAVLFKCLTGAALFEGEEAIGVLLRQATEEPPRLREVLDGVPSEVDELVAQMLAREPARRLADGAEVFDRFRQLAPLTRETMPLRLREGFVASSVAARTATHAPTSLLQSFALRSNRRTLVAIASAALLAAGLAVTGGMLLGGRARTSQPNQDRSPPDCPADHCEAFEVPNAIAVDLQQLSPKVAVAVQAADRSAEPAGLTYTGSVRNGLVDMSKSTPTFFFRSSRRDKPSLSVKVARSRLLFFWSEAAGVIAMPVPRCSLPRVFAAAKARGILPNESHVTITYSGGATAMWILQAGKLTAAVHDTNCEALF